MEIGNSKTEQLLRSALEGLTARQRTIADNVANVDTPEFKATRVSFEKALSQAHGARDNSLPMFKVPGGIAGPGEAPAQVSPTVTQETDLGRRNDGNNVDIDTEMLELSDTNIRFNALIQVMGSKMTGLRYIINDGKR